MGPQEKEKKKKNRKMTKDNDERIEINRIDNWKNEKQNLIKKKIN